MNSNSKFQEMQDDAMNLRLKIQRVIVDYRFRRLAVLDDIADLSRCVRAGADDESMLADWYSRIEILREEVELCDRQIQAYLENNNKMKLIPDRLL